MKRLLAILFLLPLGLFAESSIAPLQTVSDLSNRYGSVDRNDKGETVSVSRRTSSYGWSGQRRFTFYRTSTATTNQAHVFAAKGGGRWISEDKDNEVQNVLWWGVDNTGTDDATAAIQAAADYCASTNAAARSITLLIPRGTYKISSTVTFKGSVDAKSAIFVPTSALSPCVRFSSVDSPDTVRHTEVWVPTVNFPSIDLSSGSCAVEFRELTYANIHLARTYGSTVGVRFVPSVAGFTWNNVFLGQHIGHKESCVLWPTNCGLGYGWVNENNFYGGNLNTGTNHTGLERYSGSVGIKIRRTTTDCNNNRFYGTAIEGSGFEYLGDIDGRANLFHWLRNERTGATNRWWAWTFATNNNTSIHLPTHYNEVQFGFMSPENQMIVTNLGTAGWAKDNVVRYGNKTIGDPYVGAPVVNLQSLNANTAALALYPSTADLSDSTSWTTAWSNGLLKFQHAGDGNSRLTLTSDGVIYWSDGSASSDISAQRNSGDLWLASNSGGIEVIGPKGLGVNASPSSAYPVSVGGTLAEHLLVNIYNASPATNASSGYSFGITNALAGGSQYGWVATYPQNYFQAPFANRTTIRSGTSSQQGVGVVAAYSGQSVDITAGGNSAQHIKLRVEDGGAVLANDGAGAAATSRNTNVVLDVRSSTQGILPPRLTDATATGLSSPPDFTTYANTDKGALQVIVGSKIQNIFSAEKAQWYTWTNGSGKYVLNILWPDGSTNVVATQP